MLWCFSGTGAFAGTKEAALDNIFSWQLLPADAAKESGTTPCTVYGAHHLLRLFGKLLVLLRRLDKFTLGAQTLR